MNLSNRLNEIIQDHHYYYFQQRWQHAYHDYAQLRFTQPVELASRLALYFSTCYLQPHLSNHVTLSITSWISFMSLTVRIWDLVIISQKNVWSGKLDSSSTKIGGKLAPRSWTRQHFQLSRSDCHLRDHLPTQRQQYPSLSCSCMWHVEPHDAQLICLTKSQTQIC